VYPSAATILKSQQADVKLGYIREQLQLSRSELLTAAGVDEKRLLELKHYHIDPKNSLLYYSTAIGADGDIVLSDRCIVVPHDGKLVETIVYLNHYAEIAGHPSRADMIRQIRDAGYWWSSMKADCDRFISKCRWCLASKRARQARQGLYTMRKFLFPFQSVSWDFIDFSKGKPTAKGNSYLLVIMCNFSRWIELYAMPTRLSKDVARQLLRWCYRWGAPEILLNDPGTEFKNQVVNILCKFLRVRQITTTTANKNAMAHQERSHRLVVETLRIFVNLSGNLEQVGEWDEFLDAIEWKSHTTLVQHLGFTPYHFVVGRSALMPSDPSVLDTEAKRFPQAKAYIEELRVTQLLIWQRVSQAEVLAHAKRSAEMNRKRTDVSYKVGDFVEIWSPLRRPGVPSKLLENWVGPFHVERVLPHKQYSTIHIDTGHRKECHVEMLSLSPTEWEEGDYKRRLQHAYTKAKFEYRDVADGDFALFDTGSHGVFPALVLQVLASGDYLVQWYNCASGKKTAVGLYKPSWFDEKSGREVITDKPTAKQELVPTWNLQVFSSVRSPPFAWNESKKGRMLPAVIAGMLFPAKKPAKQMLVQPDAAFEKKVLWKAGAGKDAGVQSGSMV
jgi:hypothetical protein